MQRTGSSSGEGVTGTGHLAKQYNVSRPTINRAAKVADALDAIGEASPEAKRI